MKKLFLFVMIILPTTLLSQTVSGLKVETAAGSPGTVTFDVEWNKADLDLKTLWLDSVWVFVDYNKNGKMERLLISGGTLTEHTATKAGTGKFIKEPDNDKGAWVYGDARTNAAGSFSAKVELYTKETDIIIAGACAYASSYPPVSTWLDDAKLGFAGTPMYEITLTDGSTTVTVEAGDTFLLPCSYTMSSFTDATGAPGIINCKPPASPVFAVPFMTVCAGETVTLTAVAPGAASYSINGSDWYASNVFEVPSASNASYTLYAQTADGCVASATDAAVVTVNPLATNLTLAASTTTVCDGQPVTLTASADGGVQYSLTGNGTDWQLSNIFSETPGANASYTLYVQTAASCTVSLPDAATVTVGQKGGNGQSAICGCTDGNIDCTGTCRKNEYYETNDGECTGTCKTIWTQRHHPCGVVESTRWNQYYGPEVSCGAPCAPVYSATCRTQSLSSTASEGLGSCENYCRNVGTALSSNYGYMYFGYTQDYTWCRCYGCE